MDTSSTSIIMLCSKMNGHHETRIIPTLPQTTFAIGRPGSGRRRRGTDIEDAAAERDIERIAPEQIHRRHAQEQDRRLPPLGGAEQVGLAKHHHQQGVIAPFPTQRWPAEALGA